MGLSNDEKETIITFDETSDPAYVFTYNKAWQKHIEKRLGIAPFMDNGYGGRDYRIDKKRIPMPKVPRQYSPEALKELKERARNIRRSGKKQGGFRSKTTVGTVNKTAQPPGKGKDTRATGNGKTP